MTFFPVSPQLAEAQSITHVKPYFRSAAIAWRKVGRFTVGEFLLLLELDTGKVDFFNLNNYMFWLRTLSLLSANGKYFSEPKFSEFFETASQERGSIFWAVILAEINR